MERKIFNSDESRIKYDLIKFNYTYWMLRSAHSRWGYHIGSVVYCVNYEDVSLDYYISPVCKI